MRNSLATTCIILLSLAFLACGNFGVVEEGKLYRRSQPSEATLDEIIVEKNIQTVLRLRGGEPGTDSYDDSYNPTQKHGIRFVQIPMSSSRFPKEWELIQLVEVIEQGPYPMLVHCRAGADRTGLASSIYLLHTGADMETARAELTLWYGHMAMFGTEKLDETLDMYEPWQPYMSVGDWAREIYQRPINDELPDDFEKQNQLALERWLIANPERALIYNRWHAKRTGGNSAEIDASPLAKSEQSEADASDAPHSSE